MSTVWSGVVTFILYIAPIITIAEFIFQLLKLFNGIPKNFVRNSRKATLGKIARLNPTFSEFYDTVSFVDEGTKLGPLFVRTFQFIFSFIFYLVFALVARIILGVVISIIFLLMSATLSLFLLIYYYFVDDFSQFHFTERQDYIFTVIKPQIQKFSINISQNLLLIYLVWFYLFLGIIVIIGLSQFLSYVVSTPIFPLSLAGISVFLSVMYVYQFNLKRDELITWAFEKYRKEENLKLPVKIEKKVANGSREVISGTLHGIGPEIAILQDDGLIQEIPWKKIANTIVGPDAVLRENRITELQNFFDDLIGKPLTIYNKVKVTEFTWASFPNPFKRALSKLEENVIKYLDERTGAEVMQFFLYSWEIKPENGKRSLYLYLSTEFGAPPIFRFKVRENIDFVIRTDDNGTSYKILSYDLKKKVLAFKEIPSS